VDECLSFRKSIPCEIVPGQWSGAVVVRLECDVHAEARLTPHVPDDEVVAPVVGVRLRIRGTAGLFGGQIETEEGDVGIDRGLEGRKAGRGGGGGLDGGIEDAKRELAVDVGLAVHAAYHRFALRLPIAIRVARQVCFLRVY